MPAKRATPAKKAAPEKEYFKNANTWKQISTNVPPQMLAVLKSRVTAERTMSHLLREIIAESALMRYGQLPQPSWCVELTQTVGYLKEEILAERKMRTDVEKALFELRQEIAELRNEVNQPAAKPIAPMTMRQERHEHRARMVARFHEARIYGESDNQPVKEKPAYWPIINRLTEMLGVTRKTA